jgi:carboxyl-terminal processing protease
MRRIREVALYAQNKLKLSCVVTLMEFTCGACYAVDEYTLYLTPHQLRELCDSLRGGAATVGLPLVTMDGKLIAQMPAPLSPAAKDISAGDEIITIDRKSTRGMSAEDALTLLSGPQGTTVEVEVLTPGREIRSLRLTRQANFGRSVSFEEDKVAGVGYIQIASFIETTAQEVDEALAYLSAKGMKSLVLDLRGNDGGLFEVAIDVAQRFLSTGVITSTENVDPSYNKIYEAKNPTPITLPLVVLIDGDTASAAEVLAGALKDNRRARLVGQTTFGKGCTQCILELPSATGGVPTGGMRLTVARFFSPEGIPYNGRGVSPHLFVERLGMGGSMMGGEADQQLSIALQEAQRLAPELPRSGGLRPP